MQELIHSLSGDVTGAILGILTLAMAVGVGIRLLKTHSFYIFIVAILVCMGLSIASVSNTSLSLESLRTDTYDFYVAAQQMYVDPYTTESYLIGPNFYAYLLSMLFTVFGPSPFLTNNLGILSFAISCLVATKIFKEVNGAHVEQGALAFFMLSPTTIFYASLTWREPHQILFFAFAVLWAIRYLNHGRISYLLASLAFLLFGSLLHNKIILFNFAFAIILYFLSVLKGAPYTVRPTPLESILRNVAIPVIVLILCILTYGFMMADGGIISKVLAEGEAREALQDWRASAGGRTKFIWDVDFSSPLSIATSLPLVFLQFFVAPLIPLSLSSPMDLLAGFDGIVRIVLLLFSIQRFRRAQGEEKWIVGFLLLSYVLYCLIVGLGTGNAGTALRHQIKASWILVITAGPHIAALLGQRLRLHKSPHPISRINHSQLKHRHHMSAHALRGK